MNAQQLIQEADKQSFGDFKVFFQSRQTKPLEFVETAGGCNPTALTDITRCVPSKDKTADNSKSPIKSQIVISGGDKFVARQEIKHPAVVSERVFSPLPSLDSQHSLMPRTLNYTKLNQARTNLNVQSAFKDLGIEVL